MSEGSGPQMDEGGITIADGVVAKVCAAAIKDIDGIAALGGGSGGVFSSLRGGDKGTSGISVDVHDGAADIDVSMAVRYGAHVPTVAEQVRTKVKAAVESTTGLTVRAVNVLVTDIVFPEDTPA